MEDVIYLNNFVQYPNQIYDFLEKEISWDDRMSSRKTASYGIAYNYSQINYPYQKMLPVLESLNQEIHKIIGFLSNNCLINYYQDGNSKMGFHSDQVDILEANTGIVIISIGATRMLRFRKISNKEEIVDYELNNGSLFYMAQSVQKKWQHAIPKSSNTEGRMSLTFRKIKET